MNTEVVLNEQQQTNRIADGYQIYNSNLIECINQREYLIKNKYIVEDLTTKEDIEPIYQCSCNDYQFRHVLCKHIFSVQFFVLSNGA